MERIRITGNSPSLDAELERLGISATSKKIKVLSFNCTTHYAIGFEDEYVSELWLLVPVGWRPSGAAEEAETEAEVARAQEARAEFQEAQNAVLREARRVRITAEEFSNKFPEHPAVLALLEKLDHLGFD